MTMMEEEFIFSIYVCTIYTLNISYFYDATVNACCSDVILTLLNGEGSKNLIFYIVHSDESYFISSTSIAEFSSNFNSIDRFPSQIAQAVILRVWIFY